MDSQYPNFATQAQIEELRVVLSTLEGRVAALEHPPRTDPPVAATVAAVVPVATPAATPARGIAGPPAVGTSGAPRDSQEQTSNGQRVARSAAPPLPAFDWEQLLGRNWFGIAGALALAIGIGFFLRLAFENDWIGTTERVLMGLAAGLLLVGTGERAHRRYPTWAQAVTGGGIAVLYLSAYAAFGFFQIIGPVAALVALTGVAVAGGVLAVRHESSVIALLGITGAFLTPVLLGRDLPSPALFLAYIILADLGILGIASFRNWRWLTFFGLAGSYTLFAAWLDGVPAGWEVAAQSGLTAIFLIFVGATTLFHILWRREPGGLDLTLMTINAGAYYGLTFGLLWAEYQGWFGLLTLGTAGLYGLVAYTARRRGAPAKVSLFAVAIALVFLTVAVPLQLGGSWITLGWLAEGAILIWVGVRASDWRLRTAGMSALAIGTVHMLIFDTTVDFSTFVPLLNVRFGVFVLAIVAWYGGAYLYHQVRSELRQEERFNVMLLALAANALTLGLLSAEAAAYFESRGRAGALGFTQAHHYAHFTLTALWAAYAVGLTGVGLARRLPLLRIVGVGLFSIAVAKLVMFDITLLLLDDFQPVLNARFFVFAFITAVSAILAYLYYLHQRRENQGEGWEQHAIVALVMAGLALPLLALSAEAIAYYDSLSLAGTEQGKQLTLTVLWGVYAAGLIGVGIARRVVPVRVAGTLLLATTLLKLFGHDVFLLEQGYRVAAFIILGVLLLGTGLAYQRHSQVVKGFLLGKPQM